MAGTLTPFGTDVRAEQQMALDLVRMRRGVEGADAARAEQLPKRTLARLPLGAAVPAGLDPMTAGGLVRPEEMERMRLRRRRLAGFGRMGGGDG